MFYGFLKNYFNQIECKIIEIQGGCFFELRTTAVCLDKFNFQALDYAGHIVVNNSCQVPAHKPM